MRAGAGLDGVAPKYPEEEISQEWRSSDGPRIRQSATGAALEVDSGRALADLYGQVRLLKSEMDCRFAKLEEGQEKLEEGQEKVIKLLETLCAKSPNRAIEC